MKTTESAWDLMKWNGMISHRRVYFLDWTTGEELYSAAWHGNAETGIRDGFRMSDTTFDVIAVDLHTHIRGIVTADFFPGRKVVVKIWGAGERPEYKALISRADGWVGNESPIANTAGFKSLGVARHMATFQRAA